MQNIAFQSDFDSQKVKNLSLFINFTKYAQFSARSKKELKPCYLEEKLL